MGAGPDELAPRHLALGTFSFTLCFAAWGLVSAFAPRFRTAFGLSATETAFLVAVPVILGALGRIPIGMLADRFGARTVFTAVMLLTAIPAALIPQAETYGQLLMLGLFLGMAGTSFAVGVGYVSRWSPPERQGTALGIYGLGNIGQSAAVFLGPLTAALFGWQPVFVGMAGLLVLWAAGFALLARDAPTASRPKGLGAMLAVLGREELAWVLAVFYFLTFGGFVAFSIYLPTLLRDEFGLTSVDAGFRTAGFVVLATTMRPVGGWLADRIGGAQVLSGVFLVLIPFALLLSWPAMIPFTVGALGAAALLGLGNGAVFKLVPQYFPAETGTVTGLVGALGGLGGFFPPLLLGFFRDRLGVVWPGFSLLAATALLCWWMNQRVFVSRQAAREFRWPAEFTRTADRLRAGAWATGISGLLVAAIVVGSRNLRDFDPALVAYTAAVVFATWGVIYRCCVWLRKPPTRVFWRRGWSLFRSAGLRRSLPRVGLLSAVYLVGQRFIAARSSLRWWTHQCLFWGCLLAVGITFPLVFGWIHFETLPDDQMTYVAHLFGFPVQSFRIGTVFSWLLFHGLDISAFLVLMGVGLALWRRMRDRGAQSTQAFAMDFVPLILLFAISVTGLALTVSTLWLRGELYGFLAVLHAATVIATLLYLPFSKLLHVFQRPLQVGAKLYQQTGEAGPGAACARCGERFASRMHIDDLKEVLPELGFDYRIPGPADIWQEICPTCKRRTIATAQLRLKEESLGYSAASD